MNTQTKNHQESQQKKDAILPAPTTFCTNLSDAQLGIGLMIISAILFAVMGAFVHLAASEDELPSTQLLFMRAVFQVTFVVAAMFLSHEGEDQRWFDAHGALGDNPEVQRVVIARGIVGSFRSICFYYATSFLPLGDAVAVLSLHPIFTVLIAPYVLPNEPFPIINYVAAIMSVIGTIYIARPQVLFPSMDVSSNDVQSHATMGYLVGCLGSCACSSVFLLIRKAGTLKANTLQLLFSWSIFGMVVSLFIANITMTLSHWHWPSTTMAWWYILGICVSGSVAHYAMNYAGRIAPAGLASIVKSTDTVWSYLLQVIIFHQIPSKLTIFGVLLIISALSLLSLSKIFSKDTKENLEKGTTSMAEEQSTSSPQDEEIGLSKHDPYKYNEWSRILSSSSHKANYGNPTADSCFDEIPTDSIIDAKVIRSQSLSNLAAKSSDHCSITDVGLLLGNMPVLGIIKDDSARILCSVTA